MKRIIFSILTGIFFPILYVLIVVPISILIFPDKHLTTTYGYNGEATLGLILAPIALPFWGYDFIKFYNHFGFGVYLNTIWFRLFFIVGFNFSFYTILSYFLFSYLGWFKSSKQVIYQDPPNPPDF